MPRLRRPVIALLVGNLCVSLIGGVYAAPRCAPKQPDCAPTALGSLRALRAPLLREARPGKPWVTPAESRLKLEAARRGEQPLAAAERTRANTAAERAQQDATPPVLPDSISGSADLHGASLSWLPAKDPESGIAYYAYAIGTRVDIGNPAAESNLRGWQSTGQETSVRAALTLTDGMTLYASVYAVNGAGLPSAKLVLPLTVRQTLFGDAGNRLGYTLASTGIDASGHAGAGWDTAQSAEMRAFLDRMLPVLGDLYGPPSISYTVSFVRNLQRTSSAIFYPHLDEIHLGDNATFQLITHELAHAWRNDRLLSSDAGWRYDPTLSGFEEGFAQAVSYAAMTEFARRHPDFALTDKLYQSSAEWDYDFQNAPQLATTDFWSERGGTQLYWVRYEMAAAAMAKIETEHPGFFRAFNSAFYSRLNASPQLTATRALIVDIIANIAPVIEGQPARAWLDRQHVLAARVQPGPKTWHYMQHYPSAEYLIFHRIHTYDTFDNGSDWATDDGAGGWRYYTANGSAGEVELRDAAGARVTTRTLLISPTVNPPALMRIGFDTLTLTTADSHLPWPGGDASRFVTGTLPFGLYQVRSTFTSASRTTDATVHNVFGPALREGRGIWGGVRGLGEPAVITLTHRALPLAAPLVLTVTNGAFWGEPAWASLAHTATGSIDTLTGTVDVTLTTASGIDYTDSRAIGYGSWRGNQAFLFDLEAMQSHLPSNLSPRAYLPAIASPRP